MGCRIHKVVTHGEKKGKGSARRRERRLTLSLACVAGDLAASAVVFLAAKPREDWEQVKEVFSPFTRFEWQVRRQESAPGTIIPPATLATLSFTPLHDFETLGTG